MFMDIADFLAPSEVAVDVVATDKVRLLRELAARAAKAVNLPVATIVTEIERRDELGSTGIGGGVSLPHARFREVPKPFGLLVRLKRPIDFDAIDGQPVDVVFLLLLLPAAAQMTQLDALCAVAHTLRDRDILAQLRRARTAAEVYQVVTARD
jgi:PTS system nitrogen regulatory IIA component